MFIARPSWPDNWGTTRDEMRTAFACDSLLARPDDQLYRAIAVRAPASDVFRWLCQLRAAPYSYDWIDNGGRHSPRALTPGLEDLAAGQRVMRIFRLESFERDRHLTLRLADERAKRWFGELAVTYAVVDQGDTTRLVVKLALRHRRSLLGAVMRQVLPWGDLVMMRKQLKTLKRLAEHHAGGAQAA
jgi:hypothetical protein